MNKKTFEQSLYKKSGTIKISGFSKQVNGRYKITQVENAVLNVIGVDPEAYDHPTVTIKLQLERIKKKEARKHG